MSKKITKLTAYALVLMLLLTSFYVSNVKAVSSTVLGVKPVKKGGNMWCWAACCEMVVLMLQGLDEVLCFHVRWIK